MNPTEIKLKIIEGEYTLKQKTKTKSVIWEIFREIWNEKGELMPNWIACNGCKTVYSFDNRKCGTSNLLRHKCGTRRRLKGSNVQPLIPRNSGLPSLSAESKQNILDACVGFVLKDLKQCEIFSGSGFREFLQLFMSISSAQGGPFDLEDAIPNYDTLSRNIATLAQKVRSELIMEINTNVGKIGGGISLHLWNDNCQGFNHMCVKLHYVKNSSICENILCTKKLDPEENATEECIRNELLIIVGQYGLFDCLNNFTFVSNLGVNASFALKFFHGINCTVDILNNVVNDSISSNEPATNLLNSCKRVVKYFEQYNLQDRLTATLSTDAEKYRKSALSTCISVFDNWDNIYEVLMENGQLSMICDIDTSHLQEFIEYLSPFRQALNEMHGTTLPNLYLVYLWHLKVLKHLEISPTDSNMIRLLKSSAEAHYLDKMKIDIIHKVAVFLHPLLKGLKMVETEEEKLEVYQFVKSSVDEIKSMKIDGNDAGYTEQFNLRKDQPSKKIKLSETLLSFIDAEADLNGAGVDELCAYQNIKIPDFIINDFNLLKWWEGQKTYLPNLTTLANRIFAIPASITMPEKCFSPEELFVRGRSNDSDPMVVDDILFLNSHISNKGEI